MTHLEFTATYGHIMGASRALDVRERLTDLDSQVARDVARDVVGG